MARPDFDPREEYLGDGTVSVYTFDFKITNLQEIMIVEVDDTGIELQRVRGDDVSFLSSVVFNSDVGGTITLLAPLPDQYKLIILLANDFPLQPFEFKNKFDFTLSRIESAFDYVVGALQRAMYFGQRSVKLNDQDDASEFDPTLPPAMPTALGLIPGTKTDGTGWDVVANWTPVTDLKAAIAAAAAAAVSAGQSAVSASNSALSAVAAALSATNAAASAVAAAASAAIAGASSFLSTDYGFTGFSSRFSVAWSSTDLLDTLSQILAIVYTAPTISLAASGSGTIYEKGFAVTASNLSATVTKRSDPIAAVRFYLNAVLVNTVAVPNPAGGVETYSWAGSFSDTPATFQAQVDDNGATGGPSTVSSSVSFSFVYPYYVGAGVAGKTPAQVAALTKQVIAATLTKLESIVAAGGDVLYFAYPAAYGALVSILDVNSFETITDWTATTGNITGLDGNAVSYRIYEFNNPVIAGTYQYTFKR